MHWHLGEHFDKTAVGSSERYFGNLRNCEYIRRGGVAHHICVTASTELVESTLAEKNGKFLKCL